MSALRRCLLRICCRGVDRLHPAGVTGADCDDDAAEPPMMGGGGGNAEGEVEPSESSDRCDGRGVDGAEGTNGAAVGERTAFARFASSSSRVCAGPPPLGVCGSVGEPARLKLRAKDGGKGGSESCGDSGLRMLATDMVRTRPMPATLTRSSSSSSTDSLASESSCDEDGAASSTSVSVVAGVSATTGSGASSSVVSAADVLAVGDKIGCQLHRARSCPNAEHVRSDFLGCFLPKRPKKDPRPGLLAPLASSEPGSFGVSTAGLAFGCSFGDSAALPLEPHMLVRSFLSRPGDLPGDACVAADGVSAFVAGVGGGAGTGTTGIAGGMSAWESGSVASGVDSVAAVVSAGSPGAAVVSGVGSGAVVVSALVAPNGRDVGSGHDGLADGMAGASRDCDSSVVGEKVVEAVGMGEGGNAIMCGSVDSGFRSEEDRGMRPESVPASPAFGTDNVDDSPSSGTSS